MTTLMSDDESVFDTRTRIHKACDRVIKQQAVTRFNCLRVVIELRCCYSLGQLLSTGADGLRSV